MAKAQSILDLKLDGTEQGKSLSSVLAEIGKKNKAQFYFLPEWVENISFQDSYSGRTLGEAINILFQGTDFSCLVMYPTSVVIIKDPTQALLRMNAIETAVRQQKKILPLIIGEPSNSKKGQQVVITGRVTDSKNNEPIQQANIQVSGTQFGTASDEKGNYSLTLAPGAHVVSFSFIDYESKVVDLVAYQNGEVNLEMDKTPVLLEEVVIQAQTTQELATSKIGQTQLSIRELTRSPTFLGEADLVKQVQTLPGVTTVGEAAAGFNVRGGSVDQNLILYDGMPLFNSSHAFGFLSAFNSEAIRDATFYRGGIPAEFGGRASSVLDIQSKDGDYEKWNGKIGIGMVTSNFAINGPLQKEKTSLSASFRTTYSDWLVNSIRTDYADLRKSTVSFYDATLKLSHKFNNKTKLTFSGYSSRDGFRLVGDSTYQWDNLQGSAKLYHQFSNKLISEFLLGVSTYGYSVNNQNLLTSSELSYRITSSLVKAGFNYQRGNQKINFGWQLVHYKFDPGTLKPTSILSNAKNVSIDKQYSIENAFYASSDWTLNEKIFVEVGVRLPMFISFGPASVNLYKEGVPREITNVIDTLRFGSGQAIKTYFGFEPRLSFRWTPNTTSSIKLGHNRMYQFLNLVTNTTAVTPVDIWQPSGYYFKPQRADQISLGFFKDLSQKKYGTSVEVFYKSVENIIDFKDGAQLILNKHLETDLLQGKGYSYGVETTFSKNTGRLTWSFNYTYSRSFRQIAGYTASESINNGKEYPSNFDQPHIANFSWKYNLARRIFFTGNFTYHTGRPVTIPLSAFRLENTTVAYFSERNQYRIPDYHRLDVALAFEGNHRRKKLAEGTIVISVYNVYGRQNPYTVFFKSSGTGIPVPYQLSIIGTIFPSVSYNLKF
jgi:CarboxypepD_reg-like domain/TonB-dependent Receptor Plug Domain